MIEVYMVCEDPDDVQDGDIIAEFKLWREAIEYVNWYRVTHALEMEEDEWGICAYNDETGEYY